MATAIFIIFATIIMMSVAMRVELQFTASYLLFKLFRTWLVDLLLITMPAKRIRRTKLQSIEILLIWLIVIIFHLILTILARVLAQNLESLSWKIALVWSDHGVGKC